MNQRCCSTPNCGQPIPVSLLGFLPETTKCPSCASLHPKYPRGHVPPAGSRVIWTKAPNGPAVGIVRIRGAAGNTRIMLVGSQDETVVNNLDLQCTDSCDVICHCQGSDGVDRRWIPMNRARYDNLKAQLDSIQNVEMVAVARRIDVARNFDDLSENADYHAALKKQSMLECRTTELRDMLSHAQLVDSNSTTVNEVVIGTRVSVKDIDLCEEDSFDLVNQGDVDLERNKISVSSPIARSLLGKKRGDIAECRVPLGLLRFEIIDISLPDA